MKLTDDRRFLRQNVLTPAPGREFLIVLDQAASLDLGDAFVFVNGRRVVERTAWKALDEVRRDLTRLAWHIDNRDTPGRIEPDRLFIQRDHPLRHPRHQYDRSCALRRRRPAQGGTRRSRGAGQPADVFARS